MRLRLPDEQRVPDRRRGRCSSAGAGHRCERGRRRHRGPGGGALVADAVPAGSAVLLVGGEGLRIPLEERGLRCVGSLDDEPVAVVQGFHPDVGWRALAEASYAIESGLPWFASNTDMTIPTARGIAPGNGSLVQAVRNATGATPTVAGKPERALFDETLERMPGRPTADGGRPARHRHRRSDQRRDRQPRRAERGPHVGGRRSPPAPVAVRRSSGRTCQPSSSPTPRSPSTRRLRAAVRRPPASTATP